MCRLDPAGGNFSSGRRRGEQDAETNAEALARTVGSVAFTAAARSVIAFGYDPDDEDSAHSGSRVLAHAKSNVGPLAQSLAYVAGHYRAHDVP